MIVAWMGYAILFGVVVVIAAIVMEAITLRTRRPARYVWVAALTIATAGPIMCTASRSETIAVRGLEESGLSGDPLRHPNTRTREQDVFGTSDKIALFLWAFATTTGLLWCIGGAIWMRAWRRRMPTSVIDGTRVRLSGRSGPAVAGVTHPEVLAPDWIRDLPGHDRTLLLLHEQEHARARDPALIFASTIVAWLAPWNPALWYALSRLRAAIEADCDARVLRAYPDRRSYVSLLLRVYESQQMGRLRWTSATTLAGSSSLLKRVNAMTISPLRYPAIVAAGSVVLVGTLACAVIVVPPPRVEPAIRAAFAHSGLPRKAEVDHDRQMIRQATVPDSTIVYREDQVSKPAQLLSWTPPVYPAVLRAAGVEGEVIMEFIVAREGTVEAGSERVVRATQELFQAAAVTALRSARFSPAMRDSEPVRQLVQLPFKFAIQPR